MHGSKGPWEHATCLGIVLTDIKASMKIFEPVVASVIKRRCLSSFGFFSFTKPKSSTSFQALCWAVASSARISFHFAATSHFSIQGNIL